MGSKESKETNKTKPLSLNFILHHDASREINYTLLMKANAPMLHYI